MIKNDSEIKIPASLIKLHKKAQAGTGNEAISMLISDVQMQQRFMGVLSALNHKDSEIPPWVKKVSEKLFESMGLGFLLKMNTDQDDTEFSNGVGKIVGLTELSLNPPSPESTPQEKIENSIAVPFVKFAKEVASAAKPKDAAAFFNGRNDSEKLKEKISQPAVRAKIYMILALSWQDMGKVKSTGDLYKRLLDVKNEDGNALLPSSLDSREVRKICKDIGLDFNNPWRKPKQKN